MIKIVFVVVMLCASFFSASAQESKKPFIYQINAVYANADLDEKAIDKYKKRDAEWGEPREALKLFKPVKGNYKVIFFVATDYGLSAIDDKEHIFHELLILKVNKNNEILDGLQYILEWAEVPTASRLCRIAQPGIKLRKNLPVSQLDCQNFETARVIPLGGVLDNLYNFQEIF